MSEGFLGTQQSPYFADGDIRPGESAYSPKEAKKRTDQVQAIVLEYKAQARGNPDFDELDEIANNLLEIDDLDRQQSEINFVDLGSDGVLDIEETDEGEPLPESQQKPKSPKEV